MKKKVILALLAMSLLAAIFSLECSAEDGVSLPDEFVSVVDELPSDVKNYLPSEFSSEDADALGESVSQMMSVDYLFSIIGEHLGANMGGALSLFASLIGIIILSALFSTVRLTSLSGTLRTAVGYCSSVALFATVIASELSTLEAVKGIFERVGALMLGMIPATSVIYAMGGNVSTAAASGGVLYLFLSFCETFCASTVIPIASILTAFCLSSTLSPNLRLSSLSSALKKCYTVSLGFIMSVFLCVLSSQTLLSASADGISARAAKLVATNVIPIVGGSVGDTLRTVASSVGYIKNVCGIGAIFFILLLVLPILISLLLTRTVFILSAAFADMLGCERENKVLSELGGIYGTLLAVVSMVSVMFILAMGIFVRCTVAAA